MTKDEQIEFSTSPTSESVSEPPERRQTSSASFHDFLPSHCITTADCSARTYYGQSKFKTRRFTEPAPSSTSKIVISHTEKQQSEKPSAIRRSTLQTSMMQEYVVRWMNLKSSRKGGSAVLSRLFSRSSGKMDEGIGKTTVYEYDSDEEVFAFEEPKEEYEA